MKSKVPEASATPEPIIGSEGAAPRPAGSLLADLIGNYGHDEAEAEFDVVLPKGDKIRCLRLFDRVRITEVRAAANRFAFEMSETKADQLPERYQKFHTTDQDILAEAFIFSRLCLEPDFHNQELNCLIFARRAGTAFEAAMNMINLASSNMIQVDRKEFEDEGND